MKDFVIVVPWANQKQVETFLQSWRVDPVPDWLILQQDKNRRGCGVTKNQGVEMALFAGADVVVVLDDDCFPSDAGPKSLNELANRHAAALDDQPVEMFESVTHPPSRGTPYRTSTIKMPVAASMGFWTGVGDWCAVRHLAHGADAAMTFDKKTIHGRYFPLCGMNLAFRPRDWLPWCRFIDVPRYDDIWMGWLWQREAYRRGFCFNLAGPIVEHSRQSNVWQNLRAEANHAERSDTLWREIATNPAADYETLRNLLPV